MKVALLVLSFSVSGGFLVPYVIYVFSHLEKLEETGILPHDAILTMFFILFVATWSIVELAEVVKSWEK